jgi:hypothetical protein
MVVVKKLLAGKSLTTRTAIDNVDAAPLLVALRPLAQLLGRLAAKDSDQSFTELVCRRSGTTRQSNRRKLSNES